MFFDGKGLFKWISLFKFAASRTILPTDLGTKCSQMLTRPVYNQPVNKRIKSIVLLKAEIVCKSIANLHDDITVVTFPLKLIPCRLELHPRIFKIPFPSWPSKRSPLQLNSSYTRCPPRFCPWYLVVPNTYIRPNKLHLQYTHVHRWLFCVAQ